MTRNQHGPLVALSGCVNYRKALCRGCAWDSAQFLLAFEDVSWLDLSVHTIALPNKGRCVASVVSSELRPKQWRVVALAMSILGTQRMPAFPIPVMSTCCSAFLSKPCCISARSPTFAAE